MSAILALLERRGARVDNTVVDAMLAASPHRAVHGQHSWAGDGIALAHQHFALYPEQRNETQPLRDRVTGCVITCDARLDRREELGRRLCLGGKRAGSDAALVLAAYCAWGLDCVQQLRGDFAFALWDPRERLLLLARDALGARDLCYHNSAHRFVAASEVKQLLAHPGVDRRIDETKVADYLASRWDDHQSTFFQGVHYLPPGHCLLVDNKGLRQWRHWSIDLERQIHYRDDRDYAAHFCALFDDAVRERVRDLGSIGVSLSGGPDSSAVAASAAMIEPRRQVHAFSYTFERHPQADERSYTRATVARHALAVTYLPGDDDWPLSDAETWPVFADSPVQDPFVRLPLAVMRAAASAGARLILSGHYGDVLFAGGALWPADTIRAGRWRDLISQIAAGAGGIGVRRDLLQRGVRPLLPGVLKRGFRRMRPVLPGPLRARVDPELVRKTRLRERMQDDAEAGLANPPIAWSRYRQLTGALWAQGSATHRMLYHQRGLELLDPFWDRDLVEFALSVPADQLGHADASKRLLRTAMVGRLPECVRTRRDKASLYSLFEEGLLRRERATVHSLLAGRPAVAQRGYVRGDWLTRELGRGDKWSDHGYPLWLCVTLELWLQKYW